MSISNYQLILTLYKIRKIVAQKKHSLQQKISVNSNSKNIKKVMVMEQKMSEKEMMTSLRYFFRQNPFLNYDDFLEKLDKIHTDEQNKILPDYQPIKVKGLNKENPRTVENNIVQKRQETKRDESTYTPSFMGY